MLIPCPVQEVPHYPPLSRALWEGVSPSGMRQLQPQSPTFLAPSQPSEGLGALLPLDGVRGGSCRVGRGLCHAHSWIPGHTCAQLHQLQGAAVLVLAASAYRIHLVLLSTAGHCTASIASPCPALSLGGQAGAQLLCLMPARARQFPPLPLRLPLSFFPGIPLLCLLQAPALLQPPGLDWGSFLPLHDSWRPQITTPRADPGIAGTTQGI